MRCRLRRFFIAHPQRIKSDISSPLQATAAPPTDDLKQASTSMHSQRGPTLKQLVRARALTKNQPRERGRHWGASLEDEVGGAGGGEGARTTHRDAAAATALGPFWSRANKTRSRVSFTGRSALACARIAASNTPNIPNTQSASSPTCKPATNQSKSADVGFGGSIARFPISYIHRKGSAQVVQTTACKPRPRTGSRF